MKTLILTYKDNLEFAEETARVLKNDWNIDSEIIIGHKIGGQYTRTNVVMENWCDLLGEEEDTTMVLEDDVRFVKDPMDIDFNIDVNWIGFRKGRLEYKKPFITGIQAVVFKKGVLKEVVRDFSSKKKKIQIDYGLSKFLVKNKNKYSIFQPKLSYAYEQDHQSLISLDKWSQYTKPPK
tara:strand:+ start:2649 stop:3185 length:537 start_codon:yes stop_codon:yes gene_type:complete